MKKLYFKLPALLLSIIFMTAFTGCDLDEDATGRISGRVTDAGDGSAVQNALIEIVNEDMNAATDPNGYYSIEDIPEGIFTVHASADNYIAETRSPVQVFVNETTRLNFQLANLGSVGTLTGIVTNAVNGNPVQNATISVVGLTLSTTSDEIGVYTLQNVPEGIQTVNASAGFFYTSTNDHVVIRAGEITTTHFSLSPELTGEGGILRIVLTWGFDPHDLDSHLKPPEIEGGVYHIYYASRGDSANAPYIWLDHDDVDSFGPETITIYVGHSGIYHYFVYNYSQSVDEEAPDFTTSQARVQIYDRNGFRQAFNVPESGEGLFWNVCQIDFDSNTITGINQIQNTEPGGEQTAAERMPAKRGTED